MVGLFDFAAEAVPSCEQQNGTVFSWLLVAARLVAERRASTRPLPGHCAGGHAKSVDATDSQVVPPHRSLMRLHPERLLNLAAPLLVTLAISFFCFHELGFSWRWSIPAGLFTAVRMQKRGFI